MEHFFQDYYPYTNLIPTDLYPVQYGVEQCTPGHTFGPCIRNNYLIHYVYAGTGSLRIQNKEYTLRPGQLFLIPPACSAVYMADKKNPWLYRWIEFNGSLCPQILERAGLSADSPILPELTYPCDIPNCDNTSFTQDVGPIGQCLQNMVSSGEMSFETLMVLLWQFIAALTSHNPITRIETSAEGYIKQAETFIKSNLHKNVSVTSVSEYIGIDRSYLCRLFHEYKKVSPKHYIDTLKMNRATQYLKLSYISVTEVALSLGYCDCHAFHKAFKKHYGCSPSAWRNKSGFEQTIQDF